MSRSSSLAFVALVALTACKKDTATTDTPPAKRTGDAADKMWNLAPDKMIGGFVVTPQALLTADKIVDRARILAQDPELGLVQMMLDQITAVVGSPTAHLADAGFSTAKGFAYFQTDDELMFAILPMGDRDKLVRTLHGQRGTKPEDPDVINTFACKLFNDNYVCTKPSDLDKLERLGKGGKKIVEAKLAKLGVRGDIELYAGVKVLDGAIAALTLENGQLALDAYVDGKLAAFDGLAAADKPKPDTENAAGFVVANLKPFLKDLPMMILPGGTLPDLAKTIKGTLTGVMAAGAIDFSTKIPLEDPAPITELVSKCLDLVPPMYQAKQQTPGTCRVVIPNIVPIEVDIWVENNELRVASNRNAKPRSKVDLLTPIGKELATGGWSYAMWGRGYLVTPDGAGFPKPAQLPPEGLLAVRGLAQLSEVGIGVKVEDTGVRVHMLARTIWSNPTDVAEKLSKITTTEIFGNTAGAKAKAIADAAPTSPFATDLKAGQAGMMAPTMAIGIVTAVAIPAFMDYTKKPKRSEAELMLNRLGKNAKVAFVSTSAFPIGEAPLTPSASCCSTGKCAPNPAQWQVPAWEALDFSLDDPHLFRYSYKGTATEFTATAVGDLDCDGIEITYTLTGSVENGSPIVRLVAPPPNTD